MRTYIDIDENLLAEAKKISGLKFDKEVVEKALKLFIKVMTESKERSSIK